MQQQLLAQLRAAISGGQLTGGARLPSSRTLATALGCRAMSWSGPTTSYSRRATSPGAAWLGHLRRGCRRPRGTARQPQYPPRDAGCAASRCPRRSGTPVGDTVPGLISFRLVSRRLNCSRRRSGGGSGARWGKRRRPSATPMRPGDPELRLALARWVGRTRGIACDADDVVVTTGAAQALDLLARATLAPGDAVAFEEPGYPTGRRSCWRFGARIVPIPVDEDGLRVEELPTGRTRRCSPASPPRTSTRSARGCRLRGGWRCSTGRAPTIA